MSELLCPIAQRPYSHVLAPSLVSRTPLGLLGVGQIEVTLFFPHQVDVTPAAGSHVHDLDIDPGLLCWDPEAELSC